MPTKTDAPADGKTRVALLPAQDVETVYVNAFHTRFGTEECFLTACVSQTDNDTVGPVLTVRPRARLVMTITSARHLAQTLLQALQQRDQASQGVRDNI